jgi:hypothetical protein
MRYQYSGIQSNGIVFTNIIYAPFLPQKSCLKVVVHKVCKYYFSEYNSTHRIEAVKIMAA